MIDCLTLVASRWFSLALAWSLAWSSLFGGPLARPRRWLPLPRVCILPPSSVARSFGIHWQTLGACIRARTSVACWVQALGSYNTREGREKGEGNGEGGEGEGRGEGERERRQPPRKRIKRVYIHIAIYIYV